MASVTDRLRKKLVEYGKKTPIGNALQPSDKRIPVNKQTKTAAAKPKAPARQPRGQRASEDDIARYFRDLNKK